MSKETTNIKTMLSATERKKAKEIFNSNVRKKWGNEAIVDSKNIPIVDTIGFGSYKLDAASSIGGLVRGRLTQIYGELI